MVQYSSWSEPFLQQTLVRHQATATGGVDFSSTTSSSQLRAGAATGSYAYAAVAEGTLEPRLGVAAGTLSYAASAIGFTDSFYGSVSKEYRFARGTITGKRTPKGSLTRVYAFSGGYVHGRMPASYFTGSYTFTGAFYGEKTKTGTAAGTATWRGDARSTSIPLLVSRGALDSTGRQVSVSSRSTAVVLTVGSTTASVGKKANIVQL